MSPAGLVPQFADGDHVQTPDGAGVVVGFATAAGYEPGESPRMERTAWYFRGVAYRAPYIVQRADGATEGYKWDELKKTQ